MKLNRTSFLCLVILSTIIAGCQPRVKVPLKRDGPPLEIVGQFTNLLAAGNTLDRIGAAGALRTLALESWDQDSRQTALVALVRAAQSSDTNIQKETGSYLAYRLDSELPPSWNSAAIANVATPELNNLDVRIRCVAASLLLRQDRQDKAAASVLFSLLAHPEGAVRLQARTALAVEPTQNDPLKEQLQAQLTVLARSADPDIRLDALSQFWEMRQSKFTAARVEAEQRLLELLHSPDAEVRRRAVKSLLNPLIVAGNRLATLPLEDFIDGGLKDPDPYVAATIAHVINELRVHAVPNPPPVPGTLEALKRGLSHSDPAVRLAAMTPMNSGRRGWWRIPKGTEPGIVAGSPTASVALISADPMILESLTNALRDPNLNIRHAAVDVLRSLADWNESSFPMLWQVQIEALQSQNPGDRRRALRQAATWPKPPLKFVELFQVALKDPDWQVRLSALQPVWYSGLSGFHVDRRVWSPLCDDPAPAVRLDAGNLLGREAAMQGRGTNAPWSAFPPEVLRLVDDPFPQISLAGLIALRQLAASTNQTAVTLEARNRLHQIAVGQSPSLKVRLARCYAGAFSWARSPDTEKHLRILANAPDNVVRRHAVVALRILALSLPDGIQVDPDPEVRLAATKDIRRSYSAAVPSPDTTEVLLQKLKADDSATRRKAAMAVARDEGAGKRSGVAAEVVRILLESYTNAPPAEFDSINRSLLSQFAPNYASLHAQVHIFAVQTILAGELGVKKGVWPLLARLTSRGSYQPDQVLALTAAGLRRTQDPDVIVRVSVLRVLSALESILAAGFGDTNATAAGQVRTALVEALRDPEPEVAMSAAVAFLETSENGLSKLNRLLVDDELSRRAASILEGRLADPQLDVRKNMALALALLGAHRMDTNWVEKALTASEDLFSRPGRLREFLFNSSTDISEVSLPSGDTTLRAIAFHSRSSTVRKRAILAIVRLLDLISQSDNSLLPFPQVLPSSFEHGPFTADELDPLRQALERMAGGTNATLTEEAARCLSRIHALDDTLPGDLARRAHSLNPSERRLAMLELANPHPNQNSSDLFRKEASLLASQLSSDPDDSVRMASLEAFASNAFPTYGKIPWQNIPIEPLVKALDDSDPNIQLKAFGLLCANSRYLQASNREQIALPLLNRMMTLKFPESHFQLGSFVTDLASLVQDQTAQRRFLLDAQEKIDTADSDQARSMWLSVMGRLYLGFNQPDKAADAFRKCIRLDPNLKDDSVFRDLEKALQSAGRYNEAAFERAPRLNGFEYLPRLEAFAKEQNFAHLVLYANRALEGYLPAYGGRTQIRGWGEPDFVIREAARLLRSLGKVEVLEEFLKGALKRYPESPEIPVARAQLCLTLGRKDEAKLLLEQEMKQHFWNDAALILLGTLCRESGEPERYETLLRDLVEKRPGELSLCRPMVELCVRTGQTSEARKFITAFDAAAEAVTRNFRTQGFNSNPDLSSRYSAHEWAMSQLLELSGDLEGAIAAQSEANKATMHRPSLLAGQQRLEELTERAGKSQVTQPEK
jgi:tetratricopeptide (TPR) repeat protein